MSNSLAIAAVTATLRHVLHEALSGNEPDPVGGADVTTYRPGQLDDADTVGVAASGINVFLFQVTPNHAWNLTDLPTRRQDGSLARRPLAALDLHYLISAYGDEEALEPQRLLGRTVLGLASTPVFTRDVIAAAITKYGVDATDFLQRADLADQSDLVKITPTPMSIEEISKLWGVFGTPYLLSLTYTATVVLLEAQLAPRRALPVRERVLDVRTWNRPRVADTQVVPAGAALAGANLVLTGSGLFVSPARTSVSFSGTEVAPEATSTPDRLVCTLSDDVPAGVHAVRVVHRTPADPVAGTPARVDDISNAVPLVLTPAVTAVNLTATLVKVTVRPPLQEGQRATVAFARLSGGVPDDPASVSESFAPLAAGGAPATTVSVRRTRLTPGRWLVRVDVDGVESLPTLVGETYGAPAVTIP